jgi:hypothetical protein
VVGNPHHHAAGQIQRDDDQSGDRIAFDELARTVHRTVEIGFACDRFALAPGAVGVEQPGMHVGVDGHLLARHRIQREASGHLGDALRSACNDHELNRHQNRENDQSDDQIAVHDKRAEGRNDRADRARRRPLRQNQSRGRDVQCKAKERCNQQRRRKRRELERIFDRHRQQRRAEDVDGEQQIQQRRRQRHDENADDRQQECRKGVDRCARHTAIAPLRRSATTISATAT